MLTYYFAFRGRETMTQLREDSFSFEADSDGRNFASIKKNRASLSQKDFTNLSGN